MAGTSANPATASSWRQSMAALLALGVAVLWMYRDTAGEMVDTWGRSETFKHAFLVPVIVAWLLWRERHVLALQRPAPSPSMLLAIAFAGMVWLLGEVAAVNAMSQFAFTAVIVLAVAAVLGVRLTRAMIFPLGFLFFAVPFGEFLLPTMMEWTADFTIAALRLTGIPVYREGMQFVIPSGMWSVVEACSGVRYLIASVMVGTLFAYVTYRSTRRRLAFVAVSIAVPVLANWLRAYMIVLLAHLTDNKLAAGVDHLIYGWVFFGIVMGLMFAIGARWAEHEPPQPPQSPHESREPRPSASSAGRAPWFVTGAAAVLVTLPHLGVWAINGVGDLGTPQLVAPAAAGWQATEGELADWSPHFANPSAELRRIYVRDEQEVGLYVAYYRRQGPDRKLVSSGNALVRTEDKAWALVSSGRQQVNTDAGRLVVRTARLRNSSLLGSARHRLVVWQIYWVDGTLTASDPWAKAWGAIHKLMGRGDDGAAIVLYTRENGPGTGEAVLEEFLRHNLDGLQAQLRRARDADRM